MKILLDECVPAQLRNAFTGHEVSTVPQMGWAGIKNGKLLAAAVGAGFDLSFWPTKTYGISKTSLAGSWPF